MSLRSDIKSLIEYNYRDEKEDFCNQDWDMTTYDFDTNVQSNALNDNHHIFGAICRIMRELVLTHGY